MQPELLSVTESVTLSILTPSVLSQSGLSVVNGEQYLLSFDLEQTAGVLEVYQGTQLIYSSTKRLISVSEGIFVTDVISIRRRDPISVNESIAVAEHVVMIRV